MLKSTLNNSKNICILMATYNGEKFIADQLDSLSAQSHANWSLVVSDDGSCDKTLEIVKEYQRLLGVNKIKIRPGPKRGFAHNFLSMVCDQSINADYYAFCDQDDFWLPDKLRIAISRLEIERGDLRVYCGRTIYATEKLKKIGISPDFVHPPSFRNALIQSIAGGNTMVFNHGVKMLISRAGLVNVPSHDWWMYLLVTAADGSIYFDRHPQVIYRQHKDALVGENKSLSAKIERAVMVLNGNFKHCISLNSAALLKNTHLMSENNKIWIDVFMRMRNSNAKDRIRLLEICGLYRQTWRGTLTFMLAALLGKL